MLRTTVVCLALLLAGCVNAPTDDSGSGNNSSSSSSELPSVPAPIDDTKQVSGSADPLNFVSGGVCTSPTAQCFNYPFELNGTAKLTAELTWTVPASDFDMYVFQDGAQADSGGGASPPGPPNPREAIEETFDAGSYEIVIVAWGVAQDTYTLHAEFTAVASDEPADENATFYS